mgnify:CR=1 FL=1
MKNKKSNKGITLIALVITIIVLLILAGISIQTLTSSGLFQKTKETKETKEAKNASENASDEYYKPSTKSEVKLVADNVNKILSTTDNTELKDEYGNKITVPAGFKIKVDSSTNNATTVNQGIVIVDSNENEFVWIPVGKIYTDVAKTDANAKTIELNRYTFDESGNPTPQNESVIETYYQELETSDKGNTVAKSIPNFKTSVATNEGYYIGRYEARTTTARTNKSDSITPITEKGTDQIYNYVTQIQAAQLAQNMYNSNKFTSDLINSYAWDTATLFLQTCGTDVTYSRKKSVNTTSVSQMGTNTQETKDVQCNVYDMAGNVCEWTTETSSNLYNPCVTSGGDYFYSNTCTSFRFYGSTSGYSGGTGFRPLLFVGLNS